MSNWVIKDEFREFLSRRFEINFQIGSEFTKLWSRIDLDGFNAVKSDTLLKRIAGPFRPFSVKSKSRGNSNEPAKHKSAMGSETEDAKVRRTNLNIEKWLKVSNVNEATLGS